VEFGVESFGVRIGSLPIPATWTGRGLVEFL
jgi:hypothetical protein